jgi:DNA polymerase-3 subunit delta'
MTAIEDSTSHQPRAQMALSAALASGPSHAYLFRGPRGSGKRAAARAFAAEILACEATDPQDARRRALLDPSPHPDLVWLAPRGAQHMVGEIRERVIRAAAYRPFEGGKRVFVIEAAEAMRDESQNALLKTLEDPPGFVHLILLSSESEGLLETVSSRCQTIDFSPLPTAAVEAALSGQGSTDEIAAAARLAGGDVELARFLLAEGGKKLRAEVLELVRAVGRDSSQDRVAAEGSSTAPSIQRTPPWKLLLQGAEAAGDDAEAASREALGEQKAIGIKRTTREVAEEAKRAGRRRRTEVLDLGLALCAAWFRDLAATASGATETVFNRDHLTELQTWATALDASQARRAVELVQDTRRRLDLNVSEDLALEALSSRLRRVLPR